MQLNQPVAHSKPSVSLFGPFQLTVDAQSAVAPRSRAAYWILALLILRRREQVDRNWLAETLWPDAEKASALFYLRRSLSELRKTLGAEAIRIQSPTPRTLRFEVEGMECDLLEFERLEKGGDSVSLQKAVGLYRGELLEGCRESWILPKRRAFEQSYLGMLENLAKSEIEKGNLREAAQWLVRLTTQDPLFEDAQRLLMETLGKLGDFPGVEQQYRHLRIRLRNDLNLEPTAETIALYRELKAQAYSPSNFPRVSAASAKPPPSGVFRNLPHTLTTLIGRVGDKERIALALQSARLVTLVGPGGVGKTRLALSVGEAIAGGYSSGVCFVDLSPATDDADVLQMVADALDLKADTGLPLQEVVRQFLQLRNLLLILDNGEQIAEACALLAVGLLRSCLDLKIICTSRQPLYSAGEVVISVSPLALPEEPTPRVAVAEYAASLSQFESVVLLLDRIRSAAPNFRLTPENAPAVARICRRLDGLPLALEIVAARFRSLSAEEIDIRLDRKFRLLGTGDPSNPRHRTLQATLDWSYDLLSDGEQRLLRHLTVFRGGWTLEAAEEVSPAAEIETVALLSALVDKSLVVYEPQQSGRDRYRLLEMTRQYAADRLDVSEQAALEQRHAEFFWSLAEAEDAKASDTHMPARTPALWAERDNFRAAHSWLQNRNSDRALKLEFFLYASSLWIEDNCEQWVDKLLAQPMPPNLLGARVTHCVGTWALWNGHYGAEELLQQLLACARLCDDCAYQIYALDLLAVVEEELGNMRKALDYTEQAIMIATSVSKTRPNIQFIAGGVGKAARYQARLGDFDGAIKRLEAQAAEGKRKNDWRILFPTLTYLGEILHEHDDFAAAIKAWSDCIPFARQSCPMSLPNLWRHQASAAIALKDYEAASGYLDEALSASRLNGALDREGWTRWDMADLAFQRREQETALSNLYKAIALFQANYEPRSVTRCLIKLARYSVEWQQYGRASTLLGCAENAFEKHQFLTSEALQATCDDLNAAIRLAFGVEEWQQAWSRGRAMDLTEAVSFAHLPETEDNRKE